MTTMHPAVPPEAVDTDTTVPGAGRVLTATAAVGLLLVVVWVLACGLSDDKTYALDDAFITYIYGRNLTEGQGLRYNTTDANPTEGFSSLLHVLLVAGTHRLGLDPLAATRGLGLLLVLTIPFAFAIAGARMHGSTLERALPPATAAACVILFLPETQSHLAAGMETISFLAVHAWVFGWTACCAFGAKRLSTAGVIAGIGLLLLLALCRPEGLVLAVGYLAVVPLVWMLRRDASGARASRRRFVITVLGFGAFFTAYFVWKQRYFGYLLPNPYYVKAHNAIFGSGGAMLPGGKVITKFLLFRYVPLGAGLAAFAYWQRVWNRQISLACILLAPSLAIVLLYALAIHEVAGAFRYEYPYLVPLVGVFALCASAQGHRMRSVCFGFVLVALSTKLVFSSPNPPIARWARHPIRAATGWYTYRHRDDPLARMGLDLAETQLGSSASILLSGAGLVPYYSGFRTIDWVGLNNNELSGRHPMSITGVWAYIDAFKPDVIYSILPPATPGVSNRAEDPAFGSTTVRSTLRGRGCELFKHWDPSRVAEMFYREMCYIRDYYEFGCCYDLGGIWSDDWSLIAYVRRDSPHRSRIMAVLSKSPRADWKTDLAGVYVNDPRRLRPNRETERAGSSSE